MFIGHRKTKVNNNGDIFLIKDEVFKNYISIINYDLNIVEIMELKEFTRFKEKCQQENRIDLLATVRIGRKNSNGSITLTKEEIEVLGKNKSILLAGVGFYCELWNKEKFETYISSVTKEDLEELLVELDNITLHKNIKEDTEIKKTYDVSKKYK